MAHPRRFRSGIRLSMARDGAGRAEQARRERWDVSYLVFRGEAMETMAPVVSQLRGT